MAEDKRFILAKFAMEQGDRFQARDHLSSLLKDDPNNIEYWLLMSTVVESRKERIYCLNKVLALDPRNRDARLGMILFGGEEAGKVRSATLRKRDWLKEVPDIRQKETKKEDKKKRGYNYKQLTPLLVGSVVILLILVLTGAFPGTRSVFSPKLTITPITWTPSVVPGMEGDVTGTPVPESINPIGKVLTRPYTATPVYVLTPHPGYGTYNTALEAYLQGDFTTMLTYMKQTVPQLETADIAYLVGEAYFNLGRYHEALEQYERSLFKDASFAPAYYGRAVTSRIIDDTYDVKPDLDQAIQLDPRFGQVYIERAKYYLEEGSYQLAYEDANQATIFLPYSPLAHYYRAEALLGIQDYQEAEKSILTAMELDVNYVPSYLTAGLIRLETGNPQAALELLTRYDPHAPNKPWDFYYALGKAYFLSGEDLNRGLELIDEAIEKGGSGSDLFFIRALITYALGDVEAAIGDLLKARTFDRLDFETNLMLGRFHFEKGNFFAGLVYLNISEELAFTDSEKARLFYWRAQVLESLDRFDGSILNWEALLGLNLDDVPDEWEVIAAEKLIPTATPTPTMTDTPTITPTNTPSPTVEYTSTPEE
jgi:tetratricopeptide (TPR) repeat protein